MATKNSSKLIYGSLGLLLAVFVLAGCVSAPKVEVDACALVTQTDAEIVMDGPTPYGRGKNEGGTCIYMNDSNDLLEIYVTLFDNQDDLDEIFIQHYVYSADYTYVSGLGDNAFKSTPMYPENLVQNGDLGVLYGKYLIVIFITDDLQIEDTIELAKILVSRLPY